MAVMSGCAQSAALLKASSRTDVFREAAPEENAPPGLSELMVYSSLKTNKPEMHLLSHSTRGTAEFALVINIDGQAARIEGTLKEDNSPESDAPEAGEGIRYTFVKNVMLKAGRHRLIIASPEDHIAIEKEIVLDDGTKNFMKVEPQYARPAYTRTRRHFPPGGGVSFQNGIKGFNIWLNGVLL